jgi:hypothetical protein
MTQNINQQQVEVRERAAMKLQTFYDGLTEDERVVLEHSFRRLLSGQDMDTQGYRIREERLPKPPPHTPGGGGFLLPSIWLDTIYDPDDGSTTPLNPPG